MRKDQRPRLPIWLPPCLAPPKSCSGWRGLGTPVLIGRETHACSQRQGCPSPSSRAWGVAWAGLAQAWHSGCALRPGTSCTKEDLLRDKGPHRVQALSPGSRPKLEQQQEPPLGPATSDLGPTGKGQGPRSVCVGQDHSCGVRTGAARRVPSTWQNTGRRQRA